MRQETKQCARDEERETGDEILAVADGDGSEGTRSDGTEAGTEAVHVIGEVEGVGDADNPQDGGGVCENRVFDKEGNADAGEGDYYCYEALSDKLGQGIHGAAIVEPTEEAHAKGTEH